MDENVIDFESRKVKEQRARDELKTGCYRQPNFTKRESPTSFDSIINLHMVKCMLRKIDSINATSAASG